MITERLQGGVKAKLVSQLDVMSYIVLIYPIFAWQRMF